jgi:Histidine kinase
LKRSIIIVLLNILAINSFANLKIEYIRVDSKPVKVSHKIVLSSVNNDIVFDFQKTEADSSIFFYRLSELSQKWTCSAYPSAHYQNLSGGKYTFEIYELAGKNKSKVERIKFEVKEAFWQKSWFWPVIIVYTLMLLGIGIYLFFLYDFRQKLKMQYVRNQIASDLHDEVGSNLNSIAIFVELLKKKMPNARPELQALLSKITDNSEETVSLMRDTVWAINPDNDSTEKLIEKIESFGIEMLSSKGIAFTFNSQWDTKKNQFLMDQRRHIYMIYKEAINNIAKHAEATKVNCQLSTKDGVSFIEIIDNGQGFEVEKTFEGNGLKNFKYRSEEQNLRVIVNSEIGSGSRVLIKILE